MIQYLNNETSLSFIFNPYSKDMLSKTLKDDVGLYIGRKNKLY